MESRLRSIGHALKQAVLGNGRVRLAGREFAVVYESRSAWEEHDFPLLRALAAESRCIWDVGAHKGMTALLMVSAMPRDGRLYAFEASEHACNIIRGNAALNAVQDRVRVINALVDERSGIARDFFWDSASVFASILSYQQTGEGNGGPPMLKATLALDDFARERADAPDFVKVDVEGAERLVLRGMQQTLRQKRPLVMVEVHRLPEQSVAEHAVSLLPFVREVEYQMIALRSKSVVTDARALEDHQSRAHVLLLPAERQLPPWLASFDTSKF